MSDINKIMEAFPEDNALNIEDKVSARVRTNPPYVFDIQRRQFYSNPT